MGKQTERPKEALTHGWREHDLSMLLSSLRGDCPNLRTVITGYRQCITMQGDRYASKVRSIRTDHELYAKSALMFESVPGDEDDIELMEHENELLGTFLFNRIHTKGNFGVASDVESMKQGEIGWANITCLDDTDGTGATPLLQFAFTVRSAAEELRLQNALRGSLGSGGAYINLLVEKLEDVDGWLRQFNEDGYSPSLNVRGIYFGAEVGKGPFD